MRAPELIGRHRTVARVAFALVLAGIGATLTGAGLAQRTAEADTPAPPADLTRLSPLGSVRAGGVPDRLIFPIVGPAQWTDDFGAPRPQGSHEGNDILSDWKAPVVAVEAGKVELHTTSARAGCMLYLYGKSGTTYLYIHLNSDLTAKNDGMGGCKPGVAYAPGLQDGDRVTAGELVGYVGSSGDAGATNHLHFELHPGGGGAVSPFRWLKRAERLLFVAPEEPAALLVAADAPTLTLAGVVKRVEIADVPLPDAEEPPPGEAASEQPPADEAPTVEAPPADMPPEWPPADQIPVIVGRAGETTLITLRVSSVVLSSGGTFDVDRDVTLAVPADAIVEREKGAKVRRAKLESAAAGERVTVTTAAIDLALRSQLARPGTLGAAHVLLRGEPAA